jgi:hypothetical protein
MLWVILSDTGMPACIQSTPEGTSNSPAARI